MPTVRTHPGWPFRCEDRRRRASLPAGARPGGRRLVGLQTWSAVIVTVHRGSAGPAVQAVQDQANFRIGRGDGSLTLQVDGVFGPRTEAWGTRISIRRRS